MFSWRCFPVLVLFLKAVATSPWQPLQSAAAACPQPGRPLWPTSQNPGLATSPRRGRFLLELSANRLSQTGSRLCEVTSKASAHKGGKKEHFSSPWLQAKRRKQKKKKKNVTDLDSLMPSGYIGATMGAVWRCVMFSLFFF